MGMLPTSCKCKSMLKWWRNLVGFNQICEMEMGGGLGHEEWRENQNFSGLKWMIWDGWWNLMEDWGGNGKGFARKWKSKQGRRAWERDSKGYAMKWERKEDEKAFKVPRKCSTGRATKHGPVLHSGCAWKFEEAWMSSVEHGACWATRPRVLHCLKFQFWMLDSREKGKQSRIGHGSCSLNTGRVRLWIDCTECQNDANLAQHWT